MSILASTLTFLTGFTERCDGKTGYMAKTSLVAEEKRKNLRNPE